MRWTQLIGPGLVLMTLAVFLQTGRHEFVNYDDNLYVTENPYVQNGVSPKSLTWAFTTNYTGNWIPLTWLSLMIDATLYGDDAGAFHLSNVALHAANVLLLFAALRQMTGENWKCAFVAALFAVHPLHVESVAWISERKDVLSTLFGVISIWAYARYAQKGSIACYLTSLGAFAFSLLSKQMLVTLPFVFLLLDYWPLDRLSAATPQPNWRRLVVEKMPFFALAAVFSGIAFLVQQSEGNVSPLDELPFHIRVGNALLVYVIYLRKAILPYDLAVFYPHPGHEIPWVAVSGAAVFLSIITLVAVALARRRPYLIVGWLWYLGTALPVIGLVQIGDQQMADRYTYVPLIGCFVAVAWLVPALSQAGVWQRFFLPVAAIAILAAFMTAAIRQTAFWQNSVSLFQHALDVTDDQSFLVHYNLGNMLLERGRVDEAVRHFEKALDIAPNDSRPHHNLGVILDGRGQTDEALAHYQAAVRIDPRDSRAQINLGIALQRSGETTQAMSHYQLALRFDPTNALAHNNMAVALEELSRFEEALEHYVAAAKSAPDDPRMHNNLGVFLMDRIGKKEAAIWHFRRALSLNPGNYDARENLQQALAE